MDLTRVIQERVTHSRQRASRTHASAEPPTAARAEIFNSEQERLSSFQRSLDALLRETEAKLGAEDVAHLRRVATLSSVLQVVGRVLLQVSFEPISFSLGVASLSVHKTLELMEIGHSVLHGSYDKLPVSQKYRSRTFSWRAPIDERSWHLGHNVRHHQYTNVAQRDPDLDFGGLRLSERIRHKRFHRLQPLSNVGSWLNFANAINLHVTGLLDVYFDKSDPPVLERHDSASIRAAHIVFLRKYLPYYAREYVFYPALAGPFFWKVLLGNMLSEMLRDVWAGAVIYCGHVGARDFPCDTRAGSRAAFYAMQAEAAWDIDLSPALSVLAGGLDKQIEHHLFPRLPPNRLREIAPKVRAICEAHDVPYRAGRLLPRVGAVLRELGRLGRRDSDVGTVASAARPAGPAA